MEETLTLTRVIENINYVYGEKLVKTVFAFLLFEIIAIIVLSKVKPEWLKKAKYIALVIAMAVSILFAWRAKSYVGYDKLHTNSTICSTKTSLEDRDYEDFSWAEKLIYEYHYEKVHGPSEEIEFDESVLCKESSSEYLRQILISFFVLITGYFFTRCVLKGENRALTTFMSAPVGAGITIALTLLIMLFRIPYCLASVLIGFILIWGGMVAYSVKRRLEIKKEDAVILILFLMFAFLSAIIKFYQFSGDSRWQLALAMELVKAGKLSSWHFAQATTFGFFGISLHALALLVGVDYFYSYYALMIVSGIVMVIISTALLERQKLKEVMTFVALGIVVMLLNFDYEFFSMSILSNGSVGVYLLAIAALTVLYLKNGINSEALLVLCALAVLTTRIEGVCYVVLLLCIPFKREGKLKNVNHYVGFLIIFWQIMQFIYSDGSGVDGWTKATGIALVFVGAFLCVEPYIVRIKFFDFVAKHYQLFYALILVLIIAVGFAYDGIMARDNIAIFLSHFSVSKWSNSLSLWSFVIMLLPFALVGEIKRKDTVLSMALFSLVMVYGISIFRTGNPLNTELSDSFRRIICQMMPMTMWLITYYAGENYE